jgi:hypothetical protein
MGVGCRAEQSARELGSESEHSRLECLTTFLQFFLAQPVDEADHQDSADKEGQQENRQDDRSDRRPPNLEHVDILPRAALTERTGRAGQLRVYNEFTEQVVLSLSSKERGAHMRLLLLAGILLAGPVFLMAAQAEDGSHVLRFMNNATEQARRVLFHAFLEVNLVGGDSIKTEHLLLGLIRESPSLIGRFLRSGDSVQNVRSEVIRSLGADPDLVPDYDAKQPAELHAMLDRVPPTSREAQLSPECGQLLIGAYEQARSEQISRNGKEPEEVPIPSWLNRSDTPREMTEEMKAEMARMNEAVRRGVRPYVEPKHVLIAILSAHGTPAEQILIAHGLKLDDVRRALLEDESEE